MVPHILHGLRRVLPTERSTHDWVSFDQFLPNRCDGVRIDPLAKRGNDLDDVDTRIRLAQTMEKHSRLNWRQLIRIDCLRFSVPRTEQLFLAGPGVFCWHLASKNS